MNKFYAPLTNSLMLILTFIFSFSITPRVAQGTLPLVSDDAGLVQFHILQLELSNEYSVWTQTNFTNKENELSPIFTYGLSKNLNAVVIIPYSYAQFKTEISTEQDHEFGGVYTEWKWQFYNRGMYSFALKPTLGFPSDIFRGNGNTNNFETSLFLLGSLNVNDLLFHCDLGYYDLLHIGSTQGPRWHFSVANEMPFTKKWSFVTNIWTEFGGSIPHANQEWSLLGGIVYSVQNNLAFDVGLEHAFNSSSNNISILAGSTILF